MIYLPLWTVVSLCFYNNEKIWNDLANAHLTTNAPASDECEACMYEDDIRVFVTIQRASGKSAKGEDREKVEEEKERHPREAPTVTHLEIQRLSIS